MAIVAMPLTSCDEDDEPVIDNGEEEYQKPGEDYVEETRPVTAYDGLSWLQSNLVELDDNNNVIRRVYGKPLDASQPTVISVPVNDFADADSTFLRWVAPGKETIKVDGGYDYNLTDRDGNPQGAVSFRAVGGEAGVIACMDIAPGTDLKQVTEVKFIDADLWPENAASERYTAGKTYWLDSERYEWVKYRDNQTTDFRIVNDKLEFYCLQGNDQGYGAILVWLSPDNANSWQTVDGREQYVYTHPTPSYYLDAGLNYRLPHLCELLQVMNFYNSNRNAWNNMLKVMDGKGYQWSASTGTNATCTSEFVFGGNEGELLLLDLDEVVPTLGTVNKYSFNDYRYMQVRFVPRY